MRYFIAINRAWIYQSYIQGAYKTNISAKQQNILYTKEYIDNLLLGSGTNFSMCEEIVLAGFKLVVRVNEINEPPPKKKILLSNLNNT